MTATEFAAYCRRIRLGNDPAALAHIRAELEEKHATGSESDSLVLIATLKLVRFLDSN